MRPRRPRSPRIRRLWLGALAVASVSVILVSCGRECSFGQLLHTSILPPTVLPSPWSRQDLRHAQQIQDASVCTGPAGKDPYVRLHEGLSCSEVRYARNSSRNRSQRHFVQQLEVHQRLFATASGCAGYAARFWGLFASSPLPHSSYRNVSTRNLEVGDGVHILVWDPTIDVPHLRRPSAPYYAKHLIYIFRYERMFAAIHATGYLGDIASELVPVKLFILAKMLRASYDAARPSSLAELARRYFIDHVIRIRMCLAAAVTSVTTASWDAWLVAGAAMQLQLLFFLLTWYSRHRQASIVASSKAPRQSPIQEARAASEKDHALTSPHGAGTPANFQSASTHDESLASVLLSPVAVGSSAPAKAMAPSRPSSATRRRARARALSPSPPCSPPREAPCPCNAQRAAKSEQQSRALSSDLASENLQDETRTPAVSPLSLSGESGCPTCSAFVREDNKPNLSCESSLDGHTAPSTRPPDDAAVSLLSSPEAGQLSPSIKRARARQRHRSRSAAFTSSPCLQDTRSSDASHLTLAHAHGPLPTPQPELEDASVDGTASRCPGHQVHSPSVGRASKKKMRPAISPGGAARPLNHSTSDPGLKSPEPTSLNAHASHTSTSSLLSPSPGLSPTSSTARARGRRRAATEGLVLAEEHHHAIARDVVAMEHDASCEADMASARRALPDSAGDESRKRTISMSYSAAAAAFLPLTPAVPLSASPSASSTTSTASTRTGTTETRARSHAHNHTTTRSQEHGKHWSSAQRARASSRARAELASLVVQAPAASFPVVSAADHGRHDTASVLSASPASMSLSLSPPMTASVPSRPLNPQAVPYVPPPLPPPISLPSALPAPPLPPPPPPPSGCQILPGTDVPATIGPAGELLLPPLCIRDGLAYIPCLHPITGEILLVSTSLFISARSPSAPYALPLEQPFGGSQSIMF